MRNPRPLRWLLVFAGLFGAAGVVLAALAAHEPDAERLGTASSMLLFHATAILGATLAIDRGLLQRHAGWLATIGFVIGAGLFGGDLVLRQFAGHSPFPMAAPTGGTLLILGWLMLAVAAAWPPRARSD